MIYLTGYFIIAVIWFIQLNHMALKTLKTEGGVDWFLDIYKDRTIKTLFSSPEKMLKFFIVFNSLLWPYSLYQVILMRVKK